MFENNEDDVFILMCEFGNCYLLSLFFYIENLII